MSRLETEVKIRISRPDLVRKRLRELGFEIHAPRVFEANTLYDTPSQDLRKRGELLRIRRMGNRGTLLTFKRRGKAGLHKSREEIETKVENADAMEQIVQRLGLRPTFRYEKYRTEYARPGRKGIVTVDHTPIGDIMEIEGSATWIDKTARELGYSKTDYITKSYGVLYLEYCKERGVAPTNMIFPAVRR
jgi:adenylate cyclase class 2